MQHSPHCGIFLLMYLPFPTLFLRATLWVMTGGIMKSVLQKRTFSQRDWWDILGYTEAKSKKKSILLIFGLLVSLILTSKKCLTFLPLNRYSKAIHSITLQVLQKITEFYKWLSTPRAQIQNKETEFCCLINHFIAAATCI